MRDGDGGERPGEAAPEGGAGSSCSDPSPPVVITIDVGSSSSKCCAFNLPLSATAATTTTTLIICKSKKLSNIDCTPLQIASAVNDLVDEVLRSLRGQSNANVVAVGFTSFVMNLIPLDSSGGFVPPMMHYAVNNEAVRAEVDQCNAVLRRLVAERKGGVPAWRDTHSSYLPGQLRAAFPLAGGQEEEAAKRFDKVERFTTIASYIISSWCGGAPVPCSYSEASWTGCFDVNGKCWDEPYVEALLQGCRGKLPEVKDFDFEGTPRIESMGGRNAFYERWPELRGERCKIFLGIGDGAAANIGSWCRSGERIAVTVGTSAAVRVVVDDEEGEFEVPSGLWCYRVDGRRKLLGGALTDGGNIVAWTREFLNLQTEEAFRKEMGKARELAEGGGEGTRGGGDSSNARLTVVPFYSGERSTGWRGNATGVAVGLTSATSRAQFILANLEGVAFRLAAIVDLIKKARGGEGVGGGDRRWVMVASGGALESNVLWRQIIRDACGTDMVVLEAGEATCRGAATLIFESLGHRVDDVLESRDREPHDANRCRLYKSFRRTQDTVIGAMEGLWKGEEGARR